MHLGEPAGKKAKRVVWGIILFLTLLSIVAFWKEIRWVFGTAPEMPANPFEPIHVVSPLPFVFFNCIIGFFGIFWLWTVLISYQALLPISNILQHPFRAIIEAYRASWYMVFYILRQHGPAISVKDGKVVSTNEDTTRGDYPGVVVIDYNNAVVLEERNPPPGMNGAFGSIALTILQLLNVVDRYESPRVCGPGIVFTRPRERVRGVIDLRRQFRFQPRVQCYTREGIELYAPVWAVFTVGQEADVLQVTYMGVPSPENLRVVNLTEVHNGLQRVSGFSDELDEEDRLEIHNFAQCHSHTPDDVPAFNSYGPLPKSKEGFSSQGVFTAVYAQARGGNQEVIPWTELPTRVAAGFYREFLAQVNYDELYDVQEKGEFPLPQFKRKMANRMRSNGILSFRLLFTSTGDPLVRGQVYREADLRVSQVRLLKNPKVLRDRGIKVIFSGFGDLAPVNEAVYNQRLDAWQATWDRELDENMASSELEAMRVRARAHIAAQQDMWHSLSQLFENQEHSDEALAIRVLQSLDQVASDPRTRTLLPGNTIDLLRYINTLLTPHDAPGGPPPLAPGGAVPTPGTPPIPPAPGTAPAHIPPPSGGQP